MKLQMKTITEHHLFSDKLSWLHWINSITLNYLLEDKLSKLSSIYTC